MAQPLSFEEFMGLPPEQRAPLMSSIRRIAGLPQDMAQAPMQPEIPSISNEVDTPPAAPPPNVNQRQVAPPPPSGLSPELMQALKDSLEQQKSGLSTSKEAIKTYLSAPAQLDLSPLAALSDSLTKGGKLSQGYERPANPQRFLSGLSQLQNLSQEQRKNITDSLIRIAGQKSQNAYMEALKQHQLNATQNRFEEKNLLNKEETIRKDLEKSVFEPINKREEQFSNIDAAFATGDYQTIGAMLSQFARGVSGEKGVLTDQDIYRVMPKNIYGDAAKIRAYFSNTPSSEMDPKYVEKLRQLVSISKQNAAKVYAEHLGNKRGLYSKSKSYKDLFTKGNSGDLMLGEAEQRIKNFGGAPQQDKKRRLEELRAKKAAGTLGR